jgi:hypothetical protein
MSDTTPQARAARRSSRTPAKPVDAPSASRGPADARARTGAEIAALVRLAELDAVFLGGEDGRKAAAYEEMAAERHGLGARLPPELLEAYERALRGGRQPAVVRLVASVCSGCHVRLHATLDQKIRRVRGVAACPHCLRLVYDPGWLEP